MPRYVPLWRRLEHGIYAVFLTAFLFHPVRGQEYLLYGTPVPGSEWELADPDESTGDADPAAPDKIDFWERLQNKAFDLCRKIKLKGGVDFDLSEYGLVDTEFSRTMARMHDGSLVLIDEGELTLSAGLPGDLVEVEMPEGAGFSLGVGGRIEGRSMVLRPLKGVKSCSELDELIDPRTVKTVLPVRASRIMAMVPGELWKIPLTLTAGFAPSVSGNYQGVRAVLSFQMQRQGRTAVSLYRVDEERLRLRLRIDRAKLRGAAGRVDFDVPVDLIGLPVGDDIFTKLLDRTVSRQINRYIGELFAASWDRRTGREIVVEYVLDPRDEAQMEALAKVVKGDITALGLLTKMMRGKHGLFPSEEDALERGRQLRDEHDRALGDSATFTGVDDYMRQHSRFHLKIPFLFDFDNSSGRSEDDIVVVDGEGGRWDAHRAFKNNQDGFIDIPFVGQIYKSGTARSAQTFTHTDAAGVTRDPIAVVTLQRGFLRKSEWKVQDWVREADGVVGSAGERYGLPVEDVVPDRRSADYREGLITTTVVFGAKAIEQALNASVDAIVKAYASTLDGLAGFVGEWLTEFGTVQADGTFEYDWRVLRRDGRNWDHTIEGQDYSRAAWRINKIASRVVTDLAWARSAADPQEKAARFLRILTGERKSGLAYEKIVQVLLKLVDPAGISGEFTAHLRKKIRGEADVNKRYTLNSDAVHAAELAAVAAARARFAEPSKLRD